jgi:hypothetical protein
MEQFPQESGPYLYFPDSNSVLRGPLLWLILIGFVLLFLLGSLRVSRRPLSETVQGWLAALPHLLGLWLPWVASVVLLYTMVEVGLMEKFAVYPAVARDPLVFNPRWPAVIIMCWGSSSSSGSVAKWPPACSARCPPFGGAKSLTLLLVGLGGVYLLIRNPFSLLFLVPTLLWFLVKGRQSRPGRVLDWVLALGGGLIVYALLYFFGFVILHNNLAIFWYILMMVSIREVGFRSMAMTAAIIAAGLALVVNPPQTTAAREPAPSDSDKPAEVIA